ncbi:MAG: class II fructose-bisphosphate aldolase [Opitutaceae bacterium]|jgi:fructose-bisphosphate aldolase class II/tagatose 1,6-diphosphate aldolase GatY/KbaY|nr:class II fructose-bisphosphate aldolase [Opitutaceae bacterium]
MRLYNAKQLCDKAAAKGFAIPALNNNGGSYDIGRAIIEASEELQSPLIIQCFEPNLEYRGFDYAGKLIRELAAGITIPMAIALDHGSSPQTVLRAVRAGFTHVMIDYAHKPIAENIAGTKLVLDLVRPLGISVEAEIGHIIKSGDDSDARAPKVSVEEAKEFAAGVDVDLLAVAVGTTHGIFVKQPCPDLKLISKIRDAVKQPLVQHGTCGISMRDISKAAKAGMTKINFGEGLRMNYIKYFNELTVTLRHEGHAWRIERAAKDRLKEDIKTIIRAVGSEGKAHLFK